MSKYKIPAPALFAAVFFAALHTAAPAKLCAEPLASPSWGFRIDLPQDYEHVSGDGRDKFSFRTPGGANFELSVYPPGLQTGYSGLEALAEDVNRRLSNSGDSSVFTYRNRKAVLLELNFSIPARSNGRDARLSGWGLCMELEEQNGGTPLILALAYGSADREDLELLHLSALDSLSVQEGDQRYPGPMTEFAYPRGKRERASPAGLELEAYVHEQDSQGAQALVDREFEVLRRHADSPRWQEAWARFYRAVYRDSYGRLGEIAFALERFWAAESAGLAGKALEWVQSFAYERNFLGSDFVNPVSAALEGRGDCDSRAMLWAIILEQANIPAGIMVSADYGHAMGLADLEGTGARFDWAGKKWLVAETTAPVSLGLIGEKVSDPAHWLGIVFQ
ncbi:MAG: hypothetical protein LBK63_04310 [Treponema sp.]|jgi:hypothetical protein|nr:hypothetical protein [Treponema sp.]